jgi:hypothetical protein
MHTKIFYLLFIFQGFVSSQEPKTIFFDCDKELLRSHEFLNSLTLACLERDLNCQRHVKFDVFFTQKPLSEKNAFSVEDNQVFDLAFGPKIKNASLKDVVLPIHQITRYLIDGCEFIVS